jgi:sulfur carrier protein ThiS
MGLQLRDTMLRITVDDGDSTSEMRLEAPTNVQGLLEILGRLPDANIVIRNGTPVPLTETLFDGDSLRIIRVASGG